VIATTPDPVATHGLIARGLGVGWVPGLLTDSQRDIVIRPAKGQIPTRDVYALLPPGDRHPHVTKLIAALKDTARGHRPGSHHPAA
jgi:DNA-binding transcriptional LysR family regulator